MRLIYPTILMTFAVAPKARITLPLLPSPVKIKPGRIRLNPDLLGIATIMRSSGFEVPPYSSVNSTDDVLVLLAYNQTSSVTPLLACVVCIVVPVLPDAATLIGLPPVLPDSNIFVNVAILTEYLNF